MWNWLEKNSSNLPVNVIWKGLWPSAPTCSNGSATWFKIRNPNYSQWTGREELFDRARDSNPDWQVWNQCALACDQLDRSPWRDSARKRQEEPKAAGAPSSWQQVTQILRPEHRLAVEDKNMAVITLFVKEAAIQNRVRSAPSGTLRTSRVYMQRSRRSGPG